MGCKDNAKYKKVNNEQNFTDILASLATFL